MRLLPAKRTFRRALTRLAAMVLLIGGAAWLADRCYPPPLARASQPSAQVFDADDGLLYAFTTPDEAWRLPLKPAAVDPLYLRMLLAYEDKRFAYHPGVDPLAVVRALGQWLAHGEVVSGASTLTMQTARLLEPRPRTLTNKAIEMLRALQLEWRLPKDDILTLYLNLAPYGGNLEGLRAASFAYLGKEPARLTPAEAALLVVLPQSPSELRPDRSPERARAARDKVLQRMAELGVLSERQAREARAEPVPQRRQPMPALAPHLARWLHTTYPAKTQTHTVLDRHLQGNLEALAREQLPTLDERANLAILVVENDTRKIIAYIGSADFFAGARAGQIDLARAVRSPGSTLKPFVYGMAFDDLIIHPETLIDDVPTRFGDYAEQFTTSTTARSVSARRCNVRSTCQRWQFWTVSAPRSRGPPHRCGHPFGLGQLDQPPGLPLVLGGVGITLFDLATLYTGLANGGEVVPLRLRAEDPLGAEKHLLTPGACWYLSRILENSPPPETRIPFANSPNPRVFAHKTGTSFGFRDAWALGYDARYTVGVWVGRPDGSPSPGHYGRNTAAPLLFRVFDLLPAAAPRSNPAAPAGVLLASHAELPAPLQYFHSAAMPAPRAAAPLAISFPVDGATVELAAGTTGIADLPLLASGGTRPWRWLVNGQPVTASPLRRQAAWTPDGAGFARVTVIDGQGQSASAQVWLQVR
ncbi:MAG: penicillin-binding protein 1C [Gammaproteobacteria bacterium]